MMTKTRTKKRAAKQNRGPRLVDPSKIPTEMKVVNERVGCRRGDELMMVSFAHPDATPEMIDGVRQLYRNRWFSKREIAHMFGLSVYLVEKMVRTDPFWRSKP